MHRVVFTIGPVTVYSYGFFVALGATVAILMALQRSKKEGIRPSDLLDILTAIVIGGLAGGRLLFVAINWRHYVNAPLSVLNITEGGLAFQGALVTGLTLGAVVAVKKRVSFWKASDILAPYMALAHSLGRIGCFFNGCCYGKAASIGPSVLFPGDTIPRVPTQLYSSAGLLVIFVVLLLVRERKTFDGYVLALYLMLYSVFRVFMDIFRGDELVSFMGMGITLSQAISAGVFISGLFLYVFLKRRTRSSRVSGGNCG